MVGGTPASGNYDLTFSLFDAPTGGNQLGSTITVLSQTLSLGTFTVPLDFDFAPSQGDARWLQLAVRPAGQPSVYDLITTPGADARTLCHGRTLGRHHG